jgi:hypothetical protein
MSAIRIAVPLSSISTLERPTFFACAVPDTIQVPVLTPGTSFPKIFGSRRLLNVRPPHVVQISPTAAKNHCDDPNDFIDRIQRVRRIRRGALCHLNNGLQHHHPPLMSGADYKFIKKELAIAK